MPPPPPPAIKIGINCAFAQWLSHRVWKSFISIYIINRGQPLWTGPSVPLIHLTIDFQILWISAKINVILTNIYANTNTKTVESIPLSCCWLQRR